MPHDPDRTRVPPKLEWPGKGESGKRRPGRNHRFPRHEGASLRASTNVLPNPRRKQAFPDGTNPAPSPVDGLTPERRRALEQLNREEIAKLRDRTHEIGNSVQEQVAHLSRTEGLMEANSAKLDAIHLSIKEDLRELRLQQDRDFESIKAKQDQTNGRVTALEKHVAMLKGGLAVLSLGAPVMTGLVIFAVQKLIE
jgi:hypothetical protein